MDSKSAKSAILTHLEALNIDFHDFSTLHILCEINFGDSKSAISAVLTQLVALALNIVNLVNSSLQKVQKCIKNLNPGPLHVLKWHILHF